MKHVRVGQSAASSTTFWPPRRRFLCTIGATGLLGVVGVTGSVGASASTAPTEAIDSDDVTVPTNKVATLFASDAQADDQFGWSVSVDGDTALVGTHLEDARGNESGAAYVFTRTNGSWEQQAKLTANDAQEADRFGWTVSLHGDTALVGAPGEDENGNDAGAAYVFARTNGTWTQQAKLTANDGRFRDIFGQSVSVSGDTALVGAYGERLGSSGAGAAYVFTRSGTSWMQQAKLVSSDPEFGDGFGWAVSIDGDTALVGARYEDGRAPNAGAVYVFARAGGGWVEQAKLLASDGQEGDEFGWSVSVNDDTAIVGVPLENERGTSAGAAYVFARDGGSWTQQAKLLAPDSDDSEGDRFGHAVAIGLDTAIVGAPGFDTEEVATGAAFVFTRAGTNWTMQTGFVLVETEGNERFGSSVSTDGDTALVGVPFENQRDEAAGAVCVFE